MEIPHARNRGFRQMETFDWPKVEIIVGTLSYFVIKNGLGGESVGAADRAVETENFDGRTEVPHAPSAGRRQNDSDGFPKPIDGSKDPGKLAKKTT